MRGYHHTPPPQTKKNKARQCNAKKQKTQQGIPNAIAKT